MTFKKHQNCWWPQTPMGELTG